MSHSAPSMSNAFPNLWSNVPQPVTDLDRDPIGEIPRPVFHFRLRRRKRHPPPCAPRLDCANIVVAGWRRYKPQPLWARSMSTSILAI